MVRLRRRSQPAQPTQPTAPDSTTKPDGEVQVEVQIEAEMAREAADFVTRWGAAAPPASLDYSRASLATVDGIVGEYFTQGADLPGDLHFLASAYVCEVARREFGGRYLTGDDRNPLVLVVGEPACQVGVLVFGKVWGRAANGPEDDLGFFYDGIAPALARGVDATIV